MADEEENSTDWNSTRRQILNIYGANWPAYTTQHEEWASVVIERMLTRPRLVAAVEAPRVALDWLRKEKRQRQLAQENDAAMRATISHAGTDHELKERYSKEDLTELRVETRKRCGQLFKTTFGVEWSDELHAKAYKIAVLDGAKANDYQRAVEVKHQLSRAIREAVEFVNKKRGYNNELLPEDARPTECVGRAPLGLDWFVEQFIAPISDHYFLTEDRENELRHVEESGLRSDLRARFVYQLENWNMLNLPHRGDGSSRFLTEREMAVVWILSGGSWPEVSRWKDGLTVAQYLEKVVDAFKPAVERVDAAPARDARRGPE